MRYALRRSVWEMASDIVESCQEPVNQNVMMRRANMSWKPFHKMLKGLINHGFVEQMPGKDPRSNGRFLATKQGVELVRGTASLRKIVKPILLEHADYNNKRRNNNKS